MDKSRMIMPFLLILFINSFSNAGFVVERQFTLESGFNDSCVKVLTAPDSSGFYCVANRYLGSYKKIWLIRFNNNGDTLWTKLLNGVAQDFAFFTGGKRAVIAGDTTWKIIDTAGNVLFDTNKISASVVKPANDSIVFAFGDTVSIRRLTDKGAEVWKKRPLDTVCIVADSVRDTISDTIFEPPAYFISKRIVDTVLFRKLDARVFLGTGEIVGNSMIRMAGGIALPFQIRCRSTYACYPIVYMRDTVSYKSLCGTCYIDYSFDGRLIKKICTVDTNPNYSDSPTLSNFPTFKRSNSHNGFISFFGQNNVLLHLNSDFTLDFQTVSPEGVLICHLNNVGFQSQNNQASDCYFKNNDSVVIFGSGTDAQYHPRGFTLLCLSIFNNTYNYYPTTISEGYIFPSKSLFPEVNIQRDCYNNYNLASVTVSKDHLIASGRYFHSETQNNVCWFAILRLDTNTSVAANTIKPSSSQKLSCSLHKSILTLQIPENNSLVKKLISVSLYDLQGKRTFSATIKNHAGKSTLNLNNVSNGIYLLHIDGAGGILTKKIMLKK